MTDKRIKELMNQVGFHQSHSIKELILQVENETAQEWEEKTALECAEIADTVSAKWHLHHQTVISEAIKENFGLKV